MPSNACDELVDELVTHGQIYMIFLGISSAVLSCAPKSKKQKLILIESKQGLPKGSQVIP